MFFSGLRNTYDFAFTSTGEAFAFDSDMEWDVNAPWYREVRTVHMIPGGDSGYRNGTGKFQDEYFDIVPAMRTCAAARRSASSTIRATPIPRSTSTTSSRPTGRADGCCTRR